MSANNDNNTNQLDPHEDENAIHETLHLEGDSQKKKIEYENVKVTEFPDKYGNSSALGLLGFGMATILLSFANVSLYDPNSVVIGMGIFYGGVAQFSAGVFEFKKGHTFSGSAYMSYGCFWFAYITVLVGPTVLGCKPADNNSLGVFLLFWCVFTAVMFIGTLKNAHVTLKIVFFTLALTFLLLSIGEFIPCGVVIKVGGGVGLFCGAVAMYAALGDIIEGQGYSFVPI